MTIFMKKISQLLVVPSIFYMTSCEQSSRSVLPISQEDESIQKVLLLGTSVKPSILSDGKFAISVLPQNNLGKPVLKPNLQGSVVIEGLPAITAKVEKTNIHQPQAVPGDVMLHIDGSGSMEKAFFGRTEPNDPKRLRVKGAIQFFDILKSSGLNYRAGLSFFGISDISKQSCREALSAPKCESAKSNASILDSALLVSPLTDDTVALKSAAVLAYADTSTPTYGSLIDIINYMDGNARANAQRQIVLFSDGEPSEDTATRSEACNLAIEKRVIIHSIGLGMASDSNINSDLYQEGAVKEMRAIAECTHGFYRSVSDKIDEPFTAISSGISQGNAEFTVRLSGDLSQLKKGQKIEGKLILPQPSSDNSITFSFRIP